MRIEDAKALLDSYPDLDTYVFYHPEDKDGSLYELAITMTSEPTEQVFLEYIQRQSCDE